MRNKTIDKFINRAIIKGMEEAATEYTNRVENQLKISQKVEKNDGSIEKLIERQIQGDDNNKY